MKYNWEIEFEVEEITDQHAVGAMPITSRMLNPFGTVHAGAIIWFADVMATVMALGTEKIPEDGKGFPLAVNLNSILLGNQRKGVLRAEARFVRRGKQLIVVQTRVTGDKDKLLAEITTTHIPAI